LPLVPPSQNRGPLQLPFAHWFALEQCSPSRSLHWLPEHVLLLSQGWSLFLQVPPWQVCGKCRVLPVHVVFFCPQGWPSFAAIDLQDSTPPLQTVLKI
jgi:hypothetical protein